MPSYTFSVKCRDSASAEIVLGPFTVTVTPELLFSGSPPQAVIGQPYSFAFTMSGGTAPITTNLTGALPAGLTYNAASRTISGTLVEPTSLRALSLDANSYKELLAADTQVAIVSNMVASSSLTLIMDAAHVGKLVLVGNVLKIGSVQTVYSPGATVTGVIRETNDIFPSPGFKDTPFSFAILQDLTITATIPDATLGDSFIWAGPTVTGTVGPVTYSLGPGEEAALNAHGLSFDSATGAITTTDGSDGSDVTII